MKKTYYVHGMHCDGCITSVTELLNSLAGVKVIEINLVTGKVVVSVGDDISFEQLKDSLKETNYSLTLEPSKTKYLFNVWFYKYRPLIFAFFSVVVWTLFRQYINGWSLHYAMHDFMGGFFLLFGFLKVISWKKFAESYQGYDPLAMKLPLYAYIYPAIEILLGVAYQFRLGYESILNTTTVLILGIATLGIAKVLKRKEVVKCACLGGLFSIPITWFTVFENLLMIAMATYMQVLSVLV